MEENNSKNKIYQVIVTIIILLVIILGIELKSSLNTEKSQGYNNTTENIIEAEIGEYANLNIDEDTLNIFYFNVGQADCTLITTNGYTMLIDSGNDSDGYYIAEFLKAQNIEKIDYFILTHYDEDHIGGAYKVIEELEIGVLYIPAISNDTKTTQILLSTIEDKDINVNTNLEASSEITYPLGTATWKVLNVDNGIDSNDSSIVVELYYGSTNYLFMGDATTDVENNNKIIWDEVDVLKVGHHGSNTSTSQDFLNKINPKYAIISVGINNAYDFPKDEVLERLENQESVEEIYRTDEDGTIWLMSDGTKIEFTKLDYNLDGSGRKHANIF